MVYIRWTKSTRKYIYKGLNNGLNIVEKYKGSVVIYHLLVSNKRDKYT